MISELPLLTLVTFLPLATALVLLVAGLLLDGFGLSLPVKFWRVIGWVATMVTFGFALSLWTGYDPTRVGYQFVEYHPWIPELGIHYFVGLDGISLLLILLTTFLMPITWLASWDDKPAESRSFIFFMLFLETGMIGTFTALNLFQFYLFWELMLVPMAFIIGVWGGPRRIHAAVKFFLFTLLGSLLMLVAILVVVQLHHAQFGIWTLDLTAPSHLPVTGLLDTRIPLLGPDVPWWHSQTWLFAAFALAFAIKVPLVPFHTWLPDAHVEAPTAGSVILAGVLLKMGGYGFVRLALPLFPVASADFVPLISILALIGILYAALLAMVQTDLKKLVAYSSVSHLGFVMLGIFALNIEGLEGGLLQMVHHGLATGALFLLVGMIYQRRHTREISEFGGIAKPMPVFAALFVVVVMASIGVPMLGGFVGEFLILLGVFGVHPGYGTVAVLGVVLAAAYMLWMTRRVLFGPVENPENRGLIDLGGREKFVIAALLVPIVWIGVYPETLLKRLHPPVLELLRVMEERSLEVLPLEEGEASMQARMPWNAKPVGKEPLQ